MIRAYSNKPSVTWSFILLRILLGNIYIYTCIYNLKKFCHSLLTSISKLANRLFDLIFSKTRFSIFIHPSLIHFAPPLRLLIDFKNSKRLTCILHLIMYYHYYAFVTVSLTWLAYFLSHDYLSYKFTRFFIYFVFLSDEEPSLETLDYTIRIGSTPTISYFNLYLYFAYAAHYVYNPMQIFFYQKWWQTWKGEYYVICQSVGHSIDLYGYNDIYWAPYYFLLLVCCSKWKSISI